MHWTTHLISGAAWGFLFNSPCSAAAAGVGEHLLLDIVPHHDPEHDISYVIDTILGSAMLVFLARLRKIEHFGPGRAMFWGAVGSGLPDVELTLRLFKNIEEEQYLFPTHNGTLPHSQSNLGTSLALEVALVALPLTIALIKARLKQGTESGVSGGLP